ncbi:MAG TPA: dihydroxyacetone kinase, partial [Ruminococcaceae bacterium]|nr:dihydroxyacetone kinase [Oscillospiraceae bacterium]
CCIFEGMMSVFRDGVILQNDADEEIAVDLTSSDSFNSAAAEFDGDIRFTYCTEFIVSREKSPRKDPEELRRYLETIGDCVVVVSDNDIIKTHVHTEEPNKALEAALRYGQLLTVKIDNMKEQHRKAKAAEEA